MKLKKLQLLDANNLVYMYPVSGGCQPNLGELIHGAAKVARHSAGFTLCRTQSRFCDARFTPRDITRFIPLLGPAISFPSLLSVFHLGLNVKSISVVTIPTMRQSTDVPSTPGTRDEIPLAVTGDPAQHEPGESPADAGQVISTRRMACIISGYDLLLTVQEKSKSKADLLL